MTNQYFLFLGIHYGFNPKALALLLIASDMTCSIISLEESGANRPILSAAFSLTIFLECIDGFSKFLLLYFFVHSIYVASSLCSVH